MYRYLLLFSIFFLFFPEVKAQDKTLFVSIVENQRYLIEFQVLANDDYRIKYIEDGAEKDSTDLKLITPGFLSIALDVVIDSLNFDEHELELEKLGFDFSRQIEAYLVSREIENRLEAIVPGLNIGVIQFTNHKVPVRKKTFEKKQFGGYKKLIKETMDSFYVKSVQIGFVGGAIGDVVVTGRIENDTIGRFVSFRNYHRIPLSFRQDVDRLNGGSVILEHEHLDYVDGLSADSTNQKINRFSYELDLSKVIFYDRKVIGAGTFVPKDTVLTLVHGETDTVALDKTPYINNFDGRIFSDLTGLDADNPNGILQIDVGYKHVINSRPIAKKPSNNLGDAVLLHSINPFIAFPKLQDKLRFIPADTVLTHREEMRGDSLVNVTDVNELRFHPLNIPRFANLHLGIGFNLLNRTGLSQSYKLDFTMGIYRARVDTNSIKSDVNESLDLSGVDNFNLNLENREEVLFPYSSISLSTRYIQSAHLDFEFKASAIKFWKFRDDQDYVWDEDFLLTLEANFNVHPNPQTREQSVFFRAKVFRSDRRLKSIETNKFLSLQVGYSTPLSKLFGR